MAKKSGTITYKCSNCGYSQPRWLGRCPECGEWNTLEECIIDQNAITPAGRGCDTVQKIKPVPLSSVEAQQDTRIFTGIAEFDRVLGGGATKRSAILIGGEPGIGKSTLLLQTAASTTKSIAEKANILYVSGEESAAQIKERASRLSLRTNGIQILCTMRLEDILDALDIVNPILAVIDSIQTVYSAEAGFIPGTVNQLKYSANELISWVKEHDSVLIMTAHITKEGLIAGPKSLEHMVDTVISFERNNDEIRFLRAQKNRFGSVDEIGLFEMTSAGLTEIEDPSALFLTRRTDSQPAGIACTAVYEGSRIFLVEIQALTVPAKASLSRVYSDKVDSARIARVAAVLEKRTGIHFSDQDLYVNVAGGMRLSESAIDGALAAALYSARTDIAVAAGTVVIGELSLAGEIRPVNRVKQRAKAAQNMGFTQVYAPETGTGMKKITSVKELIKELFGK
jgi:DNA repair protein RadA/Sms